ncbi:MAG: hypothetical protein AAFX87_05900 [Bacteroidota bacterium]
MIKFIILILLVLPISFSVLIFGLSKYYKSQRIRLTGLLGDINIKRIENIKTYGREENGWKNNFPSSLGWGKTTLHINSDFILVSGKSDFPFLFKSDLQPFILANYPESIKVKTGFSRVYLPSQIRTTNSGNDLELTIMPSGAFGQLKIHLTFEHIGKKDLSQLFEIMEWY